MSSDYKVLSPWADADPVSLKGLAPRVNDLNGKRIGLFHHTKPAGPCITAEVERRFKERFPEATYSYFRMSFIGDLDESKYNLAGVTLDQYNRELAAFEDWIKGVDAVVGAVGD